MFDTIDFIKAAAPRFEIRKMLVANALACVAGHLGLDFSSWSGSVGNHDLAKKKPTISNADSSVPVV